MLCSASTLPKRPHSYLSICGTLGFKVSPGWDPLTGLGTLRFEKLLEVWRSLPLEESFHRHSLHDFAYQFALGEDFVTLNILMTKASDMQYFQMHYH